jgi:DNA-binding transcriptional MerR regulator
VQSAATGVPSRTIRFYQAKGVLPAPERRGRVACYGPEHVERLRVVAQLQERGLRLRAIKDLFSRVDSGELSVEDWLGLGERLQTPWSEDAPTRLTEAELRQMGGELARVDDLERLGWAEAEPGDPARHYLVRSPGLLRIALDLARAGVDLGTAAQAERILRRRISRAADDLVALFDAEVRSALGRGFNASDLARALDALRPVAADAVRLVFAQEIERAVSQLIERGGDAAKVSRPRRAPRSGSAPHRSRR